MLKMQELVPFREGGNGALGTAFRNPRVAGTRLTSRVLAANPFEGDDRGTLVTGTTMTGTLT